jgi:hypothetical protein
MGSFSKKKRHDTPDWSERRPDESVGEYDRRLEERREEMRRIPSKVWNDVMTPG